MPREETLTVTSGVVRRDYRVVYRDDSPERAEAVAFFREHAECLFPAMRIPEEVSVMPIQEANEYLRRHPIEQQWSLLRIGRQNPIGDDDLPACGTCRNSTTSRSRPTASPTPGWNTSFTCRQ